MSRWGRLAEAADRTVSHANYSGRRGLTDAQVNYLSDTFDRVREARSNPSLLRASGIKIGRMTAEQLRIVAGNRQPWQKLAWAYRDMVPELRFALKYRSNAISRVRFYAAEIIDSDAEPIPVSMRHDQDAEKRKRVTLPEDLCRAAEDELNRLPLDAGETFLGVWSQNFDVAGDCWLHGYTDPFTGEEVWKIRSVESVDVQGRTLTVKNELGQPRPVNLETEEIYRLWIPHPAHDHLGDSALNALQDVLEEICLAGREMRAVSRSRIMQNGILFVPSSMAEQRNVREDANTPHERRQQWLEDFTAAMLAPINNEGEAGGVVPLVQTGTREEIEAVRYERFEREDSPTLLLKLEKALGRLANSLDIPPEILTGMADANHWTAWQIDNSTFRHHLEPAIRLMVDSLTGSFLRAALAKAGFPPEQVKRIRVWYDAGQITENPNRRQDALDALDHILIGPAAGREALGFNDGDAPTPEEALQLIAAKNGIDQSTAAAILAWGAREDGAENLPPEIGEPVQRAQLPAARPAPAPAAGDPTAPGGTGTPDTAPDAVAASASPAVDVTTPWHAWLAGSTANPERPGECLCGYRLNAKRACEATWQRHESLLGLRDPAWLKAAGYQFELTDSPPDSATLDAVFLGGVPYRIDETAARDLADIDTALREQILSAADQAARQALQRAGSRLRSKTTSPKLADTVRAELRALPHTAWAPHLGRDGCAALKADQGFLLAGAWEKLSGKFGGWVRTAIGKVVKRVLRALGIQADSLEGQAVTRSMRAELEARIDTAWAHLQDSLDDHLGRLLFGEDVDLQRGEGGEYDVPTSLVREALAEIGGDERPEGLPVTGLSSGSTVRGAFADRAAIHVGMEWRYGYMPRNTFEPHENLDGHRFLSWTDETLATTSETAWVGPYFRPGDHNGCQCSFLTVYALPTGGTPTSVFDRQSLSDADRREALQVLQREYLEGAP